MPSTAYNLDDLSFNRFLGYSAWFHIGLTAIMLTGVWVQRTGNAWGGIGGGSDSGVRVSLVSSAGIPMPQPSITSLESNAVDPTKGLNKEEPKPTPEPKADATKLPKFEKEKPLPKSKPSKVFESKTPSAENAVPYGKGGQTTLPSGYSDFPGPAYGGVAVRGQGGGEFDTHRYGWYIEAVKNRIYGNWQQWTIDAAARASRTMHCAITFTINRDGSLKDIHLSESSGNSSYDNSALRAVLSSDPVTKLPGDYSGSYVTATLDFNPPSIR
jgi:TonB family protein